MTFAHRGQALDWDRDEGTVVVTLHRDPCNEIGSLMLSELELLAKYIREGADEARAVVFTSGLDTGFSAGADLRELHGALQQALTTRANVVGGFKDRIPLPAALHPVASRGAKAAADKVQLRSLRRFIERIHRVFNTFDETPLTTVSAVQGICFGGGFELALTTDIIVADKTARFAFPELRLGLIPGFGGIPRLERDVGNAVVRDMLLTGRSLRAKRAHQIGLVSQLVGAGRAKEVACEVARQAARFDRETTATAKRFLKPIPKTRLAAEREQFVKLFASPTVANALTKFVESDDVRPYLP